MPDSPTDGAAGAPEEFIEAYRTYAPAVLGYLRSRAVEDPEAVMQDVFVAVLPRMGAVAGGAKGLRTLIFSIAHARVVDAVRRRNSRPPSTEFDAGRDGRSTASAEEVVITGDQSAILAAMRQLTEDQRDVITLRVVADLSVEQTAEVLDRSEGSVKQLQRRGLQTLRGLVEREEVTA